MTYKQICDNIKILKDNSIYRVGDIMTDKVPAGWARTRLKNKIIDNYPRSILANY